MLKLNAGLSRKIGEPDYGSRGASVNLELEVEGHLVAEPDALLDRIRKLFSMARQAVDEELNGHRNVATEKNHTPTANGSNGKTNGQPNGRPATASQVRAIRSICEERNLKPDVVVKDRYGLTLEALSLRDASALIDELKGKPAGRTR
jgi:hypothetical protein